MLNFDQPSNEFNSIIKVVGVGGGGSNAVNHMFRLGISGVDFIVCNTDIQALQVSPVPHKVQLGATLTEGLGAGSVPEVGRNAAIENIEEIKKILGNDTQMIFITAGMGGGTGTGAAPVIAQAAKEMGILTVGIVTIPFSFEGKKRKAQAEEGMEEMKKYVDTLLVICNEKLREIYGNLKLGEAFGHADDVLTTAAKGIAEIITTTMHINTDFADIMTVMKDSGVAIMGSGMAAGENRATKAVEQAMHSPLLNNSNIKGARYVLLNIVCGKEEITMDELGEVTDFIQDAAGQTAEIIKGYGIDETLGDNVKVTIIATGFSGKADVGVEVTTKKVEKKVHILTADEPKATVVKPTVPAPVASAPEVTAPKVAEPVAITPPPVTAAPKATVPIAVTPPAAAPITTTPKVSEPTIVTPKVAEPVSVTPKIPEPVAIIPPVVAPKAAEPFLVTPKAAEPVAVTPKKPEPIAVTPPVVTPKAAEPVAKTPVAVVPPVTEKKTETPLTTPSVSNTPVVTEAKTEEQPKTAEKAPTEPFLITKPVEAKQEEKKEEEKKQVTFEFEITSRPLSGAVIAPPVVSETPAQPVSEPKELSAEEKLQQEEQKKKAQERILKLKELSFKLKTPTGISDMENEPAYKRKNVDLESTPHSSESQVSRYTLSEGEDKKIEIKPNNSFLHDNVD
ncbi:MAG: cell division protein FtsZ [Bacteroidetes bacterium]|nr:cell division protein FtsZ [Bacteroidota bacterium]